MPTATRVTAAEASEPENGTVAQLTHQLRALEGVVSGLRREIIQLSQDDTAYSRSSRNAFPMNRLRRAFLVASTSPYRAASMLLRLVSNAPTDSLIELIRVCFDAPVGRVGDRQGVRTVGVLLCDELLRRDPNNVHALCLKGEALVSCTHYGKNDPYAPRSVMQEAYELFDTASKLGSPTATFLKGRWLLTMEPLHKSAEQTHLGVTCVKAAARELCPRALVFLAHRYETPQPDSSFSFASDLPKGKAQKERFILGYYKKAAELGDADAINDLGTSYAEGYGNLECDFDKAVEQYILGIEAGSLHAYDNVGTHYETGMAGRFPDRIDLGKALYYYRLGAKQRCPKCTYNLAVAYDEGMSGTVSMNNKKAENYYIYAIRLAEDSNDAVVVAKAAKDLIALYITRIKINRPESIEVTSARRRLFSVVGDEDIIQRTLLQVNKSIATAMRGKITALSKLVGDMNCKAIVKHAKAVDQMVKKDKASETNAKLLFHILGVPETPKSPEAAILAVGQKRTRAATRRALNSSRKKRKTTTAARKSTSRK